MSLRKTTVLVFGSPMVGTLLMQKNPLVAFELPLRILVLPGFPWVADLLMSFGEDTNEGHGPVFPDSWADRALVC